MLSCIGIGDSVCDLIIPSLLGPTRKAISSDFLIETDRVGSFMNASPASKVGSCIFFCVACLSRSSIGCVFLFSGVLKIVVVLYVAFCCCSFVVSSNIVAIVSPIESLSVSVSVCLISFSLFSCAGPDSAITIGRL